MQSEGLPLVRYFALELLYPPKGSPTKGRVGKINRVALETNVSNNKRCDQFFLKHF